MRSEREFAEEDPSRNDDVLEVLVKEYASGGRLARWSSRKRLVMDQHFLNRPRDPVFRCRMPLCCLLRCWRL